MNPVSVIIPTYNQAKLLTETINAILSQTYPVAEIVIVDDGSSDETAEVIPKMSPKVKYHRIENSGVCAARNFGVSVAASSWIAFCDHDDLWREDKLAKQMQLHERVPHLQYSFTNFAIVSDGIWALSSKFDGAPSGFFDGCENVSESGVLCKVSMYEKILRFQPIWPSTILMTADLFRGIGGFNETLGRNPSEDLEFSLRCLQKGSIGIITDPCVGVRKHPTNFSRSNYRNTLGQIEVLRYALTHHSISESTRQAIQNSIETRRVDASHGAFELQQFDICRGLLSGLPKSHFTIKLRAKQFISSCPSAIAKLLHAILTRGEPRNKMTK